MPGNLACFRTLRSAALPNGVQGVSPKGGFGRDARVLPSPRRRGACGATGCWSISWGVEHRPTTEIFYRHLVRQAQRRLQRHPCQSISELANALACSQRTLNRAFEFVGSTVRAERDSYRLDRAALILLAEKSSAEAAHQAGYASSRQLADPFRRRFGVTPSRMRRIGRAVRNVTWQAGRPGPYRGTWQQKQRNALWRAERRLLRDCLEDLAPTTMPAQRVARALTLRLPRPRQSRAPLHLYEVFGPAAQYVPDDLLRRHAAFFRRTA